VAAVWRHAAFDEGFTGGSAQLFGIGRGIARAHALLNIPRYR
jgi:hypothetical protein